MLNLYDKNTGQHLPKIREEELSDDQVLSETHKLKKQLEQECLVLGHHYQQDDVIEFADIVGDSLELAKVAARTTDKKYIIFCGVHFMAETADMLTSSQQKVLLPDLRAGCSMADMANREEVDKAWVRFEEVTNQKIVPITYINCAASLKSFVGEHGGSICTSSNARGVISWPLKKVKNFFFFQTNTLDETPAST